MLSDFWRNSLDDNVALFIIKISQQLQIIIRNLFYTALGAVQGMVLSPMLFNVYLEKAEGKTQKLLEIVNRGELLAYAEDQI